MAEVKKPRAQITISRIIDIESVTRYYKLQSASAAAPSKPTDDASIPSGWTKTEPAYQNGATNRLYFVDQTIMTNGSIYYSQVSLSSSYEAAKEAWNKANNAQNAANTAKTTADNASKAAKAISDNIYTANTTTIDGAKITTGSIKAAQIDVSDLFAQTIKATGSIEGAAIKAKRGCIGNWDISDEGLVQGVGVVKTVYDGALKKDISEYSELYIGSNLALMQKGLAFFLVKSRDPFVMGEESATPIRERYGITPTGEQYTYGEWDSVEINGTTVDYPVSYIALAKRGISAYSSTVDNNGKVQSEEKVNINADGAKFDVITNIGDWVINASRIISKTGLSMGAGGAGLILCDEDGKPVIWIQDENSKLTFRVDRDGTMYHNDNVLGEVITKNVGAKSMSSGTWTDTGASVTLPAGKYVVNGTVLFNSAANGQRGARFATSSTDYFRESQQMNIAGTTKGVTSVQCSYIANLKTSTKLNLQGIQSSGAALSTINSYIQAIRIA